MNEKYKNKPLEQTPAESDYAVLMEIRVPDCGEPKLVKFPTTIEKMDDALEHKPAQAWRCVDCCVPALMECLTKTVSLDEVSSAANVLDELSESELAVYKALIEVRGFRNLGEALSLTESLNEYLLSPEYKTPSELAIGNLEIVLNPSDREILMPYVDLHGYGEKLLELQNTVLTSYGAFERRDGKPLHLPPQDSIAMRNL